MKKRRQISQAAPKKITPEKKRRRLFNSKEQLVGFIFFVGVIVTIIWVTFSIRCWINDPKRVVLSKLIITGDRQFTTDLDIQQTINALGSFTTFIEQDVDMIQQEILRLPWIKQASVRKQWPDRLSVHLVEYSPVAYWNKAYLLDKSGILFHIGGKKQFKKLPRLYGPEETEKNVLSMFKRLSQQLKNEKRKVIEDNLYIDEISVNERYSWVINVVSCQKPSLNEQVPGCRHQQTMKIILGRKEFSERLQRFITLYPTINQATEANEKIKIIDLRYNNGAAVLRHKLSKLSV